MFRQDTKRARAVNSRKANFKATKFTPQEYPSRLNFYTVPPTAEITLDEFEQWAIDRLRVLGEIETMQMRNRSQKEIETEIKKLLDERLPLNPNPVLGDPEKMAQVQAERKKDHYSHFIVRLAFARSEDLRRRFTNAETVLFKVRWAQDEGTKERVDFIKESGVNMEQVGEEELQYLGGTLSSMNPKEKDWFKVEWDRVPELVAQRRVFMKAGMAYVPVSMQGSFFETEFRERLEKALELTARALPSLDEDDRLIPILNHLSLGFSSIDSAATTAPTSIGELRADQIDSLLPYFPLCMQSLHKNLRKDAKLKHFGRLQYTLFLKGIGLSIDEALVFWKTAFKNTPDDKFNKEYRYNFRHSYGLEGNRRNYKPKTCQQILTENQPGPQENHGCPFRHSSIDSLILQLGSMGVTERGIIENVKRDVEQKRYHIACNKVFEHVRKAELKPLGGRLQETILTPNEYFEKSWNLVNGEKIQQVVKKEESQ